MSKDPRAWEAILLLLAFLFTLTGAVQLSLALHGRLVPLELLPALEVAVCLGAAHLFLRRRPGHDPLLLPLAGLLSGLGLLLIRRLAPPFLPRQLIWFALGTALLVACALQPRGLRWLRRYRYTWLIAGLLLLALTLVFGVNPAGTGARLWLGAAGFYFQPSELLKLLMIVFVASYLAEKRALLTLKATRLGRWQLPPLAYLGPMLLMWGFSLLLLTWQRDLGAALLFFGTFLAMLYIATAQSVYVWSGLLLFLGGGAVGYQLFSHVRVRVDAWLNPWPEAAGRAFQIVQSLLAFAGGGILGQGLGQGSPTFIPMVHTDFVFSAVGEEMGLIGTLALVACFALLTGRGLRIAGLAADTPTPGAGDFERLLAAGISAMMGLQVIVITAGTSKLVPLTGVTLPFVSYGGSSLVMSFVMVGLLLHISQSATRGQSPALWPNGGRPAGMAEVIGTTLRRTAGFFLLCFAAVAVTLAYWQVVRAPALAERPDNPRIVQAELRLQRGRILDRHGAELAVSLAQPDGGSMRRFYPHPAAAPVVGYYSLRYGRSGVEQAYDSILRGEPEADEDAWGKWWNELLHRPQVGDDVQLTIDLALQEAAAQALAGHAGAAVILDASSGEVLALSSSPTYDPNSLDSAWDTLVAAPQAPFLNRATQGLYSPGPLFRTLLLAAALEQGAVSQGSSFAPVACAHRPQKAEPLDVYEVYAFGCDDVFAALSDRLDGAELLALGRRLGFDAAPALDIPTEAGLLAEREHTADGLPATGEPYLARWEIAVSPLQMALVMAAIADEGRQPVPHLSAAGEAAPTEALSPATARQLKRAMRLAATVTPAVEAVAPGREVAGQLAVVPRREAGRKPLNWFLGLVPTDGPELAVVVVIEEGRDDGQAAALAAEQMLAVYD
jgi:cell division protein FtsW (lipid II flippase)/cell division protein FtsI/penicillin-binding protein 2